MKIIVTETPITYIVNDKFFISAGADGDYWIFKIVDSQIDFKDFTVIDSLKAAFSVVQDAIDAEEEGAF